MKNLKLDQRKIYVILLHGSNNIYFTGDTYSKTPVKFNQVEAVKYLIKAKNLMKDPSTRLKGNYIPQIKRYDYLFNGIPDQVSLKLE
jgi:uncharacterized protein YdeI (BOF family)